MDSPKKNGFAIRTWSDIGVLVLLITFILSGLIWGMKLEGRYDKLQEQYKELARQVGNGILPRAEERIRNLEREEQRLRAEIIAIEKRLSEHGVNGAKH